MNVNPTVYRVDEKDVYMVSLNGVTITTNFTEGIHHSDESSLIDNICQCLPGLKCGQADHIFKEIRDDRFGHGMKKRLPIGLR